ncbi:small nuclear ribonucleoprotein E (nucleomorph) [Cryptomonas paramecium]|uniref:Small nuclear ribonucleoprotein E n=1 Tax=Cryptomonas paramaecium TaxID=2898 RepID=F2HHG9_9CRYP|nr:small nuclear ribonucleoprotein E [Cryptomonas paramecium]AEA38765.1 small nuclear ribonucleoprotein E [Cryptomonas paramecium]
MTGKLVGFDEFMNLVLSESYQIDFSGQKKFLGKAMIKGDSIATVCEYIS